MVDTEFKGVARPGVSHQFTSKLFAFEHTPQKTSSSAQNIIIFVGGLFDGLHTVPYASRLADALPPSWTLAQAILSSSYTGWGISSLQKDVEELSDCVSYFRSIKPGKIVLMGHSTGCQDVLEYLTGPGHENRKPIDGGLIQAAVSDREAIFTMMDPDTIKSVCAKAQSMVDGGDDDEILPSTDIGSIFPCPVSAKRFLSLASPNHDGDDDYFSSDLTDDQLMKTFGSLPNSTPICILLSGSDEYVQPDVDPAKLLARWIEIAKSGKGKVDENNSGVIEGATHNLAGNSESVVNDLMKRVLGFLGGI
ncbi:alpha/beta-Hydrolase [Glarea lozoyensis ATCC 20868]|uniref:Alpha/beta-Hydrolase n=1 Tax=Glarea lozoyensis (strain ATCC 20868 / MF5171) TaxID=1116229 RepID=S3CNV8_GLAL2|nr:alpha/beta-Hydrolase [Glarea lozoyensis ATCC 20868]EPE26849.1 alpha/beta-Hydrolase [Glarea lozoyensis ATCC 20868]